MSTCVVCLVTMLGRGVRQPSSRMSQPTGTPCTALFTEASRRLGRIASSSITKYRWLAVVAASYRMSSQVHRWLSAHPMPPIDDISACVWRNPRRSTVTSLASAGSYTKARACGQTLAASTAWEPPQL